MTMMLNKLYGMDDNAESRLKAHGIKYTDDLLAACNSEMACRTWPRRRASTPTSSKPFINVQTLSGSAASATPTSCSSKRSACTAPRTSQRCSPRSCATN